MLVDRPSPHSTSISWPGCKLRRLNC